MDPCQGSSSRRGSSSTGAAVPSYCLFPEDRHKGGLQLHELFSADRQQPKLKITDPDVGGVLLEMKNSEGEDVVEIPRPSNFTPNKKRTKKVKEQLDDQFLRRSKRVAKRNDGYKSKADAEDLNPEPLAIIPAPKSPPPYLTKNIVEVIATGFLQIHPTDVSDALMRLDSNEEDV